MAAVGVCVGAAMALFGLPPVDLHGPLHKLGIMDPLCGGTRAAYFTSRGDLATAWTYNPLGIIAVAGGVAFLVRSAVGFAAGWWLTVTVSLSPRARRLVYVGLVVALGLIEVRHQLRAELLMAGTYTF